GASGGAGGQQPGWGGERGGTVRVLFGPNPVYGIDRAERDRLSVQRAADGGFVDAPAVAARVAGGGIWVVARAYRSELAGVVSLVRAVDGAGMVCFFGAGRSGDL